MQNLPQYHVQANAFDENDLKRNKALPALKAWKIYTLNMHVEYPIFPRPLNLL